MADKNTLANHSLREHSNAHKGAIKILGWNCNGRKLATGAFHDPLQLSLTLQQYKQIHFGSDCSTDETVRTWSIDMTSSGRDKRDSELQLGREANALVWHPTHADQLATSAADNLIKVWDVRTSKAASTVKLKKSAFLFLAWNPASPNILAAVQQNSETFFVDLQKQRVIKTLPSTLQVNQIKFSKNGKLFFRTVASGGVEVFTFPDLVKLHCLIGHAATVYSLDINATEELLVSGAIDATVSLFELETLTCLRTFSKFDHPARGVSFSADSSYIAYYAEGTLGVNIEKTFSGDRALHLPTRKPVEDLCWNPKHLVLAFTGSFQDGSSSTDRGSSSRSGAFHIFAPKS